MSSAIRLLSYLPSMTPGYGLDPYSFKSYASPLNNFELWSPPRGDGVKVQCDLRAITSEKELENNLSVSLSLPAGALGINPFNPAGAFAREKALASNKSHMLLSILVESKAEIEKGAASLSREAIGLINGNQPEEFYEHYGPGYVSGLVFGGYYIAAIEVDTETESKSRDASLDISPQKNDSHKTKAVISRLRKELESQSFQIRSFQSGGTGAQAATTLEELLDIVESFPTLAARNPVAIKAFWQDYSHTPPFRLQQRKLISARHEFFKKRDSLECLWKHNAVLIGKLSDYLASHGNIGNQDASKSDLSSLAPLRKDLHALQQQQEIIQELLPRDMTLNPQLCASQISAHKLSEQTRSALELTTASSRDSLSPQENKTPGKSKNKSEATFNVAVVGQTGVGKSSLINYLFGKEFAKTGVGMPITQESFKTYKGSIGKLPICIFDSKGLEVDSYKQWMETVSEELASRSTSKEIQTWFHVVLYCINASSGRVQDADIAVIDKFHQSLHPVIVVLTKSDLVDDYNKNKMTEVIREKTKASLVVAVNSCATELKGIVFESFGRGELEEAIQNSLWSSILLRVPARCRALLQAKIESWEAEKLAEISKASSIAQLKTVSTGIVASLDESLDASETISQAVNEAIHRYGAISEHLLVSSIRREADQLDKDISKIQVIQEIDSDLQNKTGILAFYASSGVIVASWLGIAAAAPFVLPAIGFGLLGAWMSNTSITQAKQEVERKVTEAAKDAMVKLDLLEQSIQGNLEKMRGLRE